MPPDATPPTPQPFTPPPVDTPVDRPGTVLSSQPEPELAPSKEVPVQFPPIAPDVALAPSVVPPAAQPEVAPTKTLPFLALNRAVVVPAVISLVFLLAGGVFAASLFMPKQATSPVVSSPTTPADSSNSSPSVKPPSPTSPATVPVPPPPPASATPNPAPAPAPAASPAPKTYTIEFYGGYFQPANISIKAGDTVRFHNAAKTNMWVASDPHPQHTDYPGFDEGKAAPTGTVYSFTFSKKGSWGYHNHKPFVTGGTITVQ